MSYVCQVSTTGICITTGRLTPALFNQMMAGVNVGVALYNYGPFLVELEDCTFVRQTFSEIYRDHCPGLRQYSRWIYIGLVMVSIAVMLSLIFWLIYGRERRHRVYTKQLVPERGKENWERLNIICIAGIGWTISFTFSLASTFCIYQVVLLLFKELLCYYAFTYFCWVVSLYADCYHINFILPCLVTLQYWFWLNWRMLSIIMIWG